MSSDRLWPLRRGSVRTPPGSAPSLVKASCVFFLFFFLKSYTSTLKYLNLLLCIETFRYLNLLLALNTSLVSLFLFKHTSSDIYAYADGTSVPPSAVALGPKIMVLLTSVDVPCVSWSTLRVPNPPLSLSRLLVDALASFHRPNIPDKKKSCAKLIGERSVPNRVGTRTMPFVFGFFSRQTSLDHYIRDTVVKAVCVCQVEGLSLRSDALKQGLGPVFVSTSRVHVYIFAVKRRVCLSFSREVKRKNPPFRKTHNSFPSSFSTIPQYSSRQAGFSPERSCRQVNGESG